MADTGGLLRALARTPGGEAAWPVFERTLARASLVVVPALILAEIDYFLRAERRAMRTFVNELLDPTTRYSLQPTTSEDIARAMELDAKFEDLRLGLVDAVVAAVAERLRISRILTIDHADFVPLRFGPRLDRSFQLVP